MSAQPAHGSFGSTVAAASSVDAASVSAAVVSAADSSAALDASELLELLLVLELEPQATSPITILVANRIASSFFFMSYLHFLLFFIIDPCLCQAGVITV